MVFSTPYEYELAEIQGTDDFKMSEKMNRVVPSYSKTLSVDE